jgi:hypothetical protein
MNRLAYIFCALAAWTVSSALLLFICLFSINQTIISAAFVVIGVTFIGSCVAFATKCNKTGAIIAAGPAFVIIGILVMFVVIGLTYYK